MFKTRADFPLERVSQVIGLHVETWRTRLRPVRFLLLKYCASINTFSRTAHLDSCTYLLITDMRPLDSRVPYSKPDKGHVLMKSLSVYSIFTLDRARS